jgi:hypothetical protein
VEDEYLGELISVSEVSCWSDRYWRVVCGDPRLAVEEGDGKLGSSEPRLRDLGGTGNLKACGDTLSNGVLDSPLFREVVLSLGALTSSDEGPSVHRRGRGFDAKVHSRPRISQNLPGT